MEKTIDRFPEGAVTPPSSKSVSHRALICAALAGGEKAIGRIKNLGVSDDIDATRRGIVQIVSARNGAFSDGAVDADFEAGADGYLTKPNGLSAGVATDARIIDCGESGSTLRFLIPIAGLDGREWIFRGGGRLMDRPLDIYKSVFEKCGGVFEQGDGEVRIRGPLRSGAYELPGDVSSQFISGLLFALPLLGGDSEIILTSPIESADYVMLTTDVMSSFGVDADEVGEGGDGVANFDRTTGWSIPGSQAYRSVKYVVEGDWSQAAFFLCAGALGRRVVVDGLSSGSLQGDMRILGILSDAGCDVSAEMKPLRRACSVRALAPRSGLRAVTVDARDIPDLVPPVAALACYLEGESRIKNAGRLRLKESDRLTALAEELSKIGAGIRMDGDALVIRGKGSLDGGSADAHNDHRIAMALAVASIGCDNPVRLTGAESVSKSYPDFWRDFEKTEKYET
ncbi:MAG: 3-phosphoshikimate 1-carboxyvinyltransferase [Clostridiales Family XIII bacterium]|jgi:3-phosphoshikimate 1-carboxyvinyltransferase|nr:3-phosphoshikimate 1-carboxyvinyltransferase [Clostridiales Family XIII bacterium]